MITAARWSTATTKSKTYKYKARNSTGRPVQL